MKKRRVFLFFLCFLLLVAGFVIWRIKSTNHGILIVNGKVIATDIHCFSEEENLVFTKARRGCYASELPVLRLMKRGGWEIHWEDESTILLSRNGDQITFDLTEKAVIRDGEYLEYFDIITGGLCLYDVRSDEIYADEVSLMYVLYAIGYGEGTFYYPIPYLHIIIGHEVLP